MESATLGGRCIGAVLGGGSNRIAVLPRTGFRADFCTGGAVFGAAATTFSAEDADFCAGGAAFRTMGVAFCTFGATFCTGGATARGWAARGWAAWGVMALVAVRLVGVLLAAVVLAGVVLAVVVLLAVVLAGVVLAEVVLATVDLAGVAFAVLAGAFFAGALFAASEDAAELVPWRGLGVVSSSPICTRVVRSGLDHLARRLRKSANNNLLPSVGISRSRPSDDRLPPVSRCDRSPAPRWPAGLVRVRCSPVRKRQCAPTRLASRRSRPSLSCVPGASLGACRARPLMVFR